MLVPCLLLLAAPAQQPAQSSQHLEVRPEGAFWSAAAGSGPALQNLSGPAGVQTAPRWEDNHAGLAWIGMSAAAGDSGAMLAAGKELNNEAASFYAGGSGIPLFSVGLLGAEKVRVAASARTPLAATLVHTSVGVNNYQATASAYDTTGSGTPLWTYVFPAGGGVIAGDVIVNEDGTRVVAVSGSVLAAINMIRVFDAAGTLLTAVDAPTTAYVRQARLSADGGRLYLGLYNGTAQIWDTASGALLLTWNIGSTFDSHSLSGDGATFAYGDFGGLHVVRETSPGAWNQIAFLPVSAGGQYLATADLDMDGSHAAFQQQRYTPAYDHIEIGLFDVAANAAVWSVAHNAPGTISQLVCSGVQISADGGEVVGCSWGDSLNATPEVFGYDATGNLTLSLDTPGSAFALALDEDGDVAIVGTKAVHANTFGNGGSVFCIETSEPTLRLLGVPQLGATLTLTTPDGASSAGFGFCAQLGASATPYGTMEVLLSSLLASLGPLPVPPGGLVLNLSVPLNPAFAGMAVHVQGVRFATGGTITNKVSLRILP
jgi:hypothetical protein